ncbi:proline--tRNA ligase-like [Leguminivora glycinivorella]|uniref:proline--tRNA ligase-like n=1 Tax=Leguminivora glycinivorella TaxID=1035111 RepID=UPI00200DB476|nr:proline--tRNA ligase-like [Leguminivora glycinivorella]
MEKITALIENLQKKLDDQTKEIREMKDSIPKTINDNIDIKFENLEKNKYNTLEKTLESQGHRIQQLERISRRRNLVFFGIEENEKSYEELQDKLITIINDNMQIIIKEDSIEYLKRLGKPQEGKVRPVTVTFSSMINKIKLLKNKKALTTTPYYIKEDFPPDVLEERKKLSKQLKEEREKGRTAFIKYNKLIILPENNQTNSQKNNNNHRNQNKRNLSESPEYRVDASHNTHRAPAIKFQKTRNSTMDSYVKRHINHTPHTSDDSTTDTNAMPLPSAP